MEAAATDARAAEALGSLDLPAIALFEGSILANQPNQKDLRQAIGLLTLALQLNVDQRFWNPLVYQGIAYEGRCLAYVRLGELEKAGPPIVLYSPAKTPLKVFPPPVVLK